MRGPCGAGDEGGVFGHSAHAGHVREDGHGVRERVLALVFPDPAGAVAGAVDGGGGEGVGGGDDGGEVWGWDRGVRCEVRGELCGAGGGWGDGAWDV